MATIPSAGDTYQQKIRQRNNELARLLNGPWADDNIIRVWRDPAPTNPPDPAGPADGTWICETAG